MLDAVGGAHTVLLAHSMGAQLASEVLYCDDRIARSPCGDRLRSLAFFAPDLDAARFQTVVVPAMQPLTKRVVFYASGKDRTLAISRTLNKSERAGLIRDSSVGPMATPSRPSTSPMAEPPRGLWQRMFGSHHSLSRASAALFDLLHIVAREFPAACRSNSAPRD